MLDIKYLRENIDKVKKGVSDKNFDASLVDRVLELDEKRRSLMRDVQTLQARKNEVAEKMKSATEETRAALIDDGRRLKEDLATREPELESVEKEYITILKSLPNIAADDVKVGKDESENEVIRKWGEPTKFDFEPRDHVALGELLGAIELEKAGKITGARFGYLMGDVARLEYALVQFAFDSLTNKDILKEIADTVEDGYCAKAFIPVVPPVMINPETYDRMGRLHPTEERYYIPSDDIYLIGSAEHTLGPLHMDETLQEKDLPIRYVGFSTAFRREAGSYGKDTRGLIRMHQFDKVELESFSISDNGRKEQDFFVAIQEYFMQKLGLPYQVVAICTGDMGGPDYRQIDIETWMPGQNKYRETHTSDYMTDYQSRRLNTKVRKGNDTEYVHMNDATAFAIGRTVVAILENYQQEDGSVIIPEVLRKWMGKDRIEKRN